MRNVRIFYWTRLFDSVSFLEPVIALFYLRAGLSAAEILLIWPVMAVTNLIAEVPTGAFADRFGARASLIVGSVLRACSVAILLAFPSLWGIFVSRALYALGWTFFSGTEEAVLYESLKEAGRESTMAEVSGRLNGAGFLPKILAYLVGPLLALNLSMGQFRLLIALDLACLIIRLVLTLGVVNPKSHVHEHNPHPLAEVKQALTVIRSNPNLFWLAGHSTLVFIAANVFFTYDQPFLTGAGLPVGYLGVLYALGAAVSWFLSNQVGRVTSWFSPTAVARTSSFVSMAALVAAVLLKDSVVGAVAVYFLIRMAGVLRSPIMSQMMNDYIPSQGRATTLSVLNALDSAFDLIVVPGMAAAAAFGLPVVFIAGAGVSLLALLMPMREASAHKKGAAPAGVIPGEP